MGKIQKTSKQLETKVTSLLSGKPLWVWWAGYTAVVAVLFGVFYLSYRVLTIRWWLPVIIIIAAGVIWGTVAYSSKEEKTVSSKK